MLRDRIRLHRAIGFVWKAAAPWTALSLALLLLLSALPFGMLYVFKVIVDHLAETGAASGTLSPAPGYLLTWLGLGMGLAVLGNLFNALLKHVNAIQTFLVSDYMERLVEAKSVELDLAYYENPAYFDKLHRAQKEAPTRPLRIIEGLTALGRNGLTVVGATAVLVSFSWWVVLAVLGTSLPVLLLRLRYADALFDLQRSTTAVQRRRAYFHRLLTTSDHAKEIRCFGFGAHLAQRCAALRTELRSALRRLSGQDAKRQFAAEATASVVAFGTLAYIVQGSAPNSISVGEIVMFFGAFQIALGALRPTISAVGELYENNRFLEVLEEFFGVPRQLEEPSQPKRMQRPWTRGVQVEKLSFHYPGTDRPVLHEIDLAIRPGEIVALVGRNGSGKTTLAKLLCRLYDPDSGRITIDGVDLRRYRASEVRREISVIFQDFGRYQVSARENIWYGHPELEVHDTAIVGAAQWAGIHGYLSGLPNGYESVLSRAFDDGTELSLGQWQQIALARAFVRDSQLILLDEPTSALDPAAEFEFFERFREMARGRSALIVSHRFSTVRLAKRIYVIDRGRLVQHGSHDELVALDGLYAHLYRRQAAYYREDTQRGNQSP